MTTAEENADSSFDNLRSELQIAAGFVTPNLRRLLQDAAMDERLLRQIDHAGRPKGQVWLHGLRTVIDDFDAISRRLGSRRFAVIEFGAGAGLVLAVLRSNRPSITLAGLDPRPLNMNVELLDPDERTRLEQFVDVPDTADRFRIAAEPFMALPRAPVTAQVVRALERYGNRTTALMVHERGADPVLVGVGDPQGLEIIRAGDSPASDATYVVNTRRRSTVPADDVSVTQTPEAGSRSWSVSPDGSMELGRGIAPS